MKVYWCVEDGYVGHGRQETRVDDDDLADCETEEERQELISEAVQEDFQQTVTWAIMGTEE